VTKPEVFRNFLSPPFTFPFCLANFPLISPILCVHSRLLSVFVPDVCSTFSSTDLK
jgi:hypothetical protein